MLHATTNNTSARTIALTISACLVVALTAATVGGLAWFRVADAWQQHGSQTVAARASGEAFQAVVQLQAATVRMLRDPDAATLARFDAMPPRVLGVLTQAARETAQPQARAVFQRLMPMVDAHERAARALLAEARRGGTSAPEVRLPAQAQPMLDQAARHHAAMVRQEGLAAAQGLAAVKAFGRTLWLVFGVTFGAVLCAVCLLRRGTGCRWRRFSGRSAFGNYHSGGMLFPVPQ